MVPDGSQNQLSWFQDNGYAALGSYSDVNADVGGAVLYIAFIKPYVNGCGSVGHVWLVYKPGDGASAETLESHGGGGVDSRPWNTFTLLHEVYAAFRVPIA